MNETQGTARAEAAFADYLEMGPNRSLRGLLEVYRVQGDHKPATRRLSTLRDWSRRYRWQERLTAAITARTEAALARAAELDAQSFLRTSELVAERLASTEALSIDALVRLREAVQRPEPRGTAAVALAAALRDVVERVAVHRGLDAREVLVEAELIIRGE